MLSKPLPLAWERPPKISATSKFCTFNRGHSTLECVHAAWSVQHERDEAQKMGRSGEDRVHYADRGRQLLCKC